MTEMSVPQKPTELKAWERGTFRSRQRFHAFAHARDLPPADRSIRAAYNQYRAHCLGKSGERGASGRWELWSREDDWVGRLELWDADVDRQRRERFLKAQLDAVERHARATAAALNVTLVPVRHILTRLSDPAFQAALETQTGRPLLRDAWRGLSIMPALINAERQALGLSQMEVAVDDQRFDRALADSIVRDPVATAIAVDLLAQISRAGRT